MPVVPTVPFPGVLHPGDIHVAGAVPVKRAFERAGYDLPGPMRNFTPEWGAKVSAACERFRKARKIPLPKGTVPGTYTKEIHDALVRTHRQRTTVEWAFDPYAIRLLENAELTPDEQALSDILGYADYLAAHWATIGYDMKRAYWVIKPPPFLVHRWDCDCSGTTKSLLRWAGAPSPDGELDGFGNTATLWAHGDHITSLAQAKPGDMVFYGQPWLSGGAAHVVMLTERIGGNWRAISHGHRDSSGPSPAYLWAQYRAVVGIRRYALAP